ncbi:glycosyltransferase family 4 protein [Leptospira vanthielii]|uniref:Glycosyltransferase family 1 protein n=1 Tax=Leptospira vanthielii TaxID=293085 RepID=A0ABY2NSZ9_9LEPT|nr:glycosyltransferase family 1 protein [Leptospira vanthielii]TGM60653.1 glycosyltransferase family 1 protein [Leptospira vanthielii]
MKILFDHQIFALQTYGGISRYFFELMTHLQNLNNVTVKNSILYSRNVYLDNRFPHYKYVNYENWLVPKYFKGKNRLLKICQEIGLAPNHNKEMDEFVFDELEKGKYDIFHPTYYNPYFLESVIKYKIPYVLTVHDLIHEKFPFYFDNIEQTKCDKQRTILNASRIIAISQSTKNDLVAYYNIPEDKIDVVYHGNSMVAQESLSYSKSREKYLLFVGNRSYYKNFFFFVESILPLFKDFPDLQLYAAGGGEFTLDELRNFRKLNIDSRVIHKSFGDDVSLMDLYKNAALFVFPSLYEGFGIPLLEAMVSGCPAVCSNTSSFPEIGGESVHYFDPTNSDSIEKAVREVFTNRELQTYLRESGFKNVSRFSWAKTAADTYQVYQKGLKY